MIDRNRETDIADAVSAQVRQAAIGSLLLFNEKPRLAVIQYGRALLALENLETDLTPYSREHQLILVGAGRAAFEDEDYTAAEMSWAEAVRMRNTDIRTRFNLGVLRMCMGNPQGAEHALYGAAIASNNNPDLWQALGESRLQQGKYDSAARAFERCLSIDPSRDDATERLATAYREITRRKNGAN